MKKVIPENAVLVPENAEKVFSGEIFDVYQWPQKMFDGSYATFEMLKRPDTINVICIVDDKILILDEEQPHHGVRTNVPLGRIDKKDINTLEGAKREVVEETGYEFENWRLVEVVQFYAKIEWFMYVYVAWGVKAQRAPKLDPGETITIRKESLENVKKSALYDLAGNEKGIFNRVDSVDELVALPEFTGRDVDR